MHHRAVEIRMCEYVLHKNTLEGGEDEQRMYEITQHLSVCVWIYGPLTDEPRNELGECRCVVVDLSLQRFQ